jgi:hypothetical protein
VAGFLVEEVRLRRLPLESFERLRLLVEAVREFEGVFFEDGVDCLGYYVVWWGGCYRVFVVVAYDSPGGLFIEAVNVEEWVGVARAERLVKSYTRPP